MRGKLTKLAHQEQSTEGWQIALLEEACQAVTGMESWEKKLVGKECSVHLAILVEPYLRYILDSQKTVESRFSANRCAPYRRVSAGDVILLKRSGGPVVALCEVAHVWFYDLDRDSWREIRSDFAVALCAQDPEFWTNRQNAEFATLMRIKCVTPITPFSCSKRDRRGWAVIRQACALQQSNEPNEGDAVEEKAKCAK